MKYAFLIVNGEVLMVRIEYGLDAVYVQETNVMDGQNIIEWPEFEEYLERHPEIVEEIKRGELIHAL